MFIVSYHKKPMNSVRSSVEIFQSFIVVTNFQHMKGYKMWHCPTLTWGGRLIVCISSTFYHPYYHGWDGMY